jgi:hypothetical protein
LALAPGRPTDASAALNSFGSKVPPVIKDRASRGESFWFSALQSSPADPLSPPRRLIPLSLCGVSSECVCGCTAVFVESFEERGDPGSATRGAAVGSQVRPYLFIKFKKKKSLEG